MSIAALYRVHNVERMDYPFEQSVRQTLLLCDEICVAAGYSEDNTLEIILNLQKEFGKDRVKYVQYEFVYNREWQVLAWNKARKLTKADWLLLIDADEAFHEQDIPRLKKMLKKTDRQLVNFPMYHFYGTPNFLVTGGHFYKRHTRMGCKGIKFGMKNFRRDGNLAPVCDVVATLGGREKKVHRYGGPEMLQVDIPIYHYGWVRSAEAMGMRRVKGRAWYTNDKKFFDGHLPELKKRFNYQMKKNRSVYKNFKGTHPRFMRSWFEKDPHPKEWDTLRRQADE